MDFSQLKYKTNQSTSGGGYFAFRWTVLTDFEIIPLPNPLNKGEVIDDFIHIPGKDWIIFYTDNKEFEWTSEQGEKGNGFTETLKGFIPGENEYMRQFINDGHGEVDGYALIDNCDDNASYILGKGKCCPATLRFSWKSGKKSSDPKGWEFTVTVEQNGVACKYTGVGSINSIFQIDIDDATPDISKGTGTYLLPENSGATEITALDNAVQGALITLEWKSTTNHSTINSGTVFQLATTFTPVTGAKLILQATTSSTFAERHRILP